MKKYFSHGEEFTCLHCEIEQTIDAHKWTSGLSNTQINWLIFKDLINVLFDFLVTRARKERK